MSQTSDTELIQMIRCPVTKSRLVLASESVIAKLNERIRAGAVVNREGQPINKLLESGFLNQDHSLLLPIRGGIVILTEDQAIPLDPVATPENEVNHE